MQILSSRDIRIAPPRSLLTIIYNGKFIYADENHEIIKPIIYNYESKRYKSPDSTLPTNSLIIPKVLDY